MGIQYIPKTVTGIDLECDCRHLPIFLKEHGWNLTDEEIEQLDDEGWENFSTLKNVKWTIECKDGWADWGYTIGFEGKKKANLEIMKTAFPTANIQVFKYIQFI